MTDPITSIGTGGSGLSVDELCFPCKLLGKESHGRSPFICRNGPSPMKAKSNTVGARLRVVLRPGAAVGPGQAAMLEEIRDTGSIAAAGRRINMSYKQAWYLVKSINNCFGKPLVVMHKGGRSGGSAVLTPFGEEVLMRYRRMEKLTAKAINGEIKALKTALNEKSGR